MRIGAVILAGGKGERFGGDKVMAALGPKPVWKWSYDTFLAHPQIDSVGLVASEGNLAEIRGSATAAAFVVSGGKDRQSSSRIGAESCDADVVLLHDAARPLVSAAVIDRVLEGIARMGAAAASVPVRDTLRIRTDCGFEVLSRESVTAMQTPQGAHRDTLLRAHLAGGAGATDEMALLDLSGVGYELVPGDARNFKITTADDLEAARKMIASSLRTGFGYDIHRFSDDVSRPLFLGGVRFEGPGLDGHSDADVVIHAVVDALLGAAGRGDIGEHFPNTDARWRNEPSATFLAHAVSLLATDGYTISNVDIAVIAERPRVMPRAIEVRAALANIMRIDPSQVGFKATTNEGMDAIGRGEGIAAHAVATILR